MSSTANFERLSRLVAKHETFWASLAQRSTGANANVMQSWFHTQWDPWFTAWGDAIASGPLDENGISAAARGLTALRELAKSPQWQIPVPKVSEETTAAINVSGEVSVGGPHGGGGGRGGAPHAMHPARRPRAMTPAHRPRGFRGRGGWYRHGSRHPGRWWWGGPQGWLWVESDVNLVAPEEAASEDQENPPTLDEQPVAPESQGEPAEDVSVEAQDDVEAGTDVDSNAATDGAAGAAAVSGEVNPIVTAINDETDRRFTRKTGHATPLNREKPGDRRVLPAWLRMRYEVALEFSARQREAYARGESLDAQDVFATARESTFARDASPSSLYAQSQSDAPVESSGLVTCGAVLGAEAIEYALVGGAHALCGGWWHSITHGLGQAAGAVTHTIKKMKGPIAVAAGAAAGAAALAVPGAGPVLAPMAASMASSLVNAAVGDKSAQKVVQQAVQQAKSDPHVAHALELATRAAAQTTAAAHVVQTVDQAIQGDPRAVADVQQLVSAATQGDPGAARAIEVAQTAAQGAANDAAISSGAVPDLRAMARGMADLEHGDVIGVAFPVGNHPQVKAFATADDADDWFGRWMSQPEAVEYVAYFDKHDLTYPGPLNESFGAHHAAKVSSGHWILPMALGAGAGIAGVTLGPRAYRWVKGKIVKVSAREQAKIATPQEEAAMARNAEAQARG